MSEYIVTVNGNEIGRVMAVNQAEAIAQARVDLNLNLGAADKVEVTFVTNDSSQAVLPDPQ